MKTEEKKERAKKAASKSTELNKPGELKTDYPLSEKDEIKQAEEKLRKATKEK